MPESLEPRQERNKAEHGQNKAVKVSDRRQLQHASKPGKKCGGEDIANLPAGLKGKASYGHPVNGAAWTRSLAWLMLEAIARTGATTCELDHETLTHELGTI